MTQSSNSDAFRKALLAMDVPLCRRIYRETMSHLNQPVDDREAEHIMHLARSQMETIPKHAKDYSLAWLAEHRTGVVAKAVAIAIKMPKATDGNDAKAHMMRGKRRMLQAQLHEMGQSVLQSVQDGLDLGDDANEVKARYFAAGAKVTRRVFVVPDGVPLDQYTIIRTDAVVLLEERGMDKAAIVEHLASTGDPALRYALK